MKNLIVLTFLICLGQFASAQRQNERSNDIESYKVAYLTSKLELTPEESRAFWPIYNNWQKEQAALRAERAEKMISFRKTNEIDDLSDNQVESLLTNELNFKQKALNIEKKYYYQLKSVLPIKTVGKYYRAQETFKKELLNRYRDGRKRD
ncbi:hypothetical protein DBR11_10215 [Pedobacter sp. HMWF019]|uniref:hypothetical protein n=1 Tax=Pedobacter sp. HMWF019 TaxID=2056856 RepID=UPI000D333742|nr:hypothetical protein [Pedobacter sp. HMWF019]PTT00313.1 hypothetical protein DBR11_10215 [Pedobacter sp. HMWF019]